ncbi:hypothetical protein CK203_004046 [Vitis vinifera]|uniref:Zinc beta-ribbon domain-containing protein n=1 Tax=Vitis vinifera TaxID=29760 RepID=A0A438KAD4_VITVI|nr:hypothetical protein CK203_004046 [Vitis vinifera]
MHEKRSDCVHGGFMSMVEDDQRPAHASLSWPLPSRSDTFWAMCGGCKMEYEYLKTFLKHTLICVHCRQAFVALEAPPSSPVSRAGRSKRKRVHDHKSDTERRWEMGPSRFQMKARREISKKMREWAAGCSDCTDTATVSMDLGHGRIGKRFYAMTMSVKEPDIHDFD